ncbi:MAG TPA: hypothetical protein VHG72_14730 [Polyangia bacterium]|nr:hypothetical protein [Polyangia bacterium]
MRLPGYVFAELTVAAALVAGGGTGAFYGIRHARASFAARSASAVASEALQPHTDLSDLGDLRVSLESSGTFMGMSDELLLARVRTQPMVRFKLNHGGSSISFRVDFADGSRAAWKPTQTNTQTIPRKEIAAYRLNRLLGLNAVPPAAPRAVSREDLLAHLHPESQEYLPRIEAETIFGPNGVTMGTASYWIPVIKDSGFDTPEGQRQSTAWLSVGGEPIPPDRMSLARQISDLILFDFLTSNPDRYSGGNMKMSPDGTELFFMDNTMSFFVDPQGTEKNRDVLYRTQRFSRELVAALDRVTVPMLQRALAQEPGANYEILTPAEIDAVVGRRQLIQRYVHDLIGKYGAREVLFFP